MPNTWITDATHFLDSEGRQVQGRRTPGIVKHIGAIISAVTEPGDGLSGFPVVPCRRRPRRGPCPGIIDADVDPHGGAIVWECPACGDRGMISNWQRTPWDRGERQRLPDVRRVTYRSGMLDETMETSDLTTIVLETEELTREILVSILDNGILELGGVYGDLKVGTPIQYDELVFEHGRGKTVVRIFNRAIMLFRSRDDVYVRVHRVCSMIERPNGP